VTNDALLESHDADRRARDISLFGSGRADVKPDRGFVEAISHVANDIATFSPAGLLDGAGREPFSGTVASWTSGLRAL
jgi:hypothetical protein